MKKTVEVDLFCNQQIGLFRRLEWLKLVKVTNYIDIFDEISNQFICKRLQVSAPSWFEGILYWIVTNDLDTDGKERVDRLMKRGLVSK